MGGPEGDEDTCTRVVGQFRIAVVTEAFWPARSGRTKLRTARLHAAICNERMIVPAPLPSPITMSYIHTLFYVRS